jgi:hypothetical protein
MRWKKREDEKKVGIWKGAWGIYTAFEQSHVTALALALTLELKYITSAVQVQHWPLYITRIRELEGEAPAIFILKIKGDSFALRSL